jgi:hypothetical protein
MLSRMIKEELLEILLPPLCLIHIFALFSDFCLLVGFLNQHSHALMGHVSWAPRPGSLVPLIQLPSKQYVSHATCDRMVSQTQMVVLLNQQSHALMGHVSSGPPPGPLPPCSLVPSIPLPLKQYVSHATCDRMGSQTLISLKRLQGIIATNDKISKIVTRSLDLSKRQFSNSPHYFISSSGPCSCGVPL